VREKDTLASPLTSPPYRPFKVKRVWVSADERFVRFQLAGYKPMDTWVPHDSLVRVPEGWEWSALRGWLTDTGAKGTLQLERDHEP
jgi:hypothetical protein